MKDKITQEKVNRYKKLTEQALKIAKKSIRITKRKQAKEIIEMVENYLYDAKFFQEKGDLINAFAALNYSHGWLDSGVRLDIFNINDNKLFTVK